MFFIIGVLLGLCCVLCSLSFVFAQLFISPSEMYKKITGVLPNMPWGSKKKDEETIMEEKENKEDKEDKEDKDMKK